MFDMVDAPRDGTRILLKKVVLAYSDRGYSDQYGFYRKTGEQWEESWYDEGQWQPWLGSTRSRSTGSVRDTPAWVYGWLPLPDDVPPVRYVAPGAIPVPPTPSDASRGTAPWLNGVTQCRGISKQRGRRCDRMVSDPSGFCATHREQTQEKPR